jgi:hypothetical protein
MARKQTVVVEPEVVVEAERGGLGIDEGIVLTTFFFLLGAVILVYYANQTYLPH